MAGRIQSKIAVGLSAVAVGSFAAACGPGQAARPESVPVAGYPSEAPLMRLATKILFSSGRLGSGQGEATGPIMRDTRLERVVWRDDEATVFGLAHVDEAYFSGLRGELVVRSADGRLERLGRKLFSRVWDATAEPNLSVLALTDDGKLLITFTQNGEAWSEQAFQAPPNLRLAFLHSGRVTTISEEAGSCVMRQFDAARAEMPASSGALALCEAHAVWVLRDRFGSDAYVYAAAHQSSALFQVGPAGDLKPLATDVEAGPPGLQPTHLAMIDGVLYFDGGADEAGTPLLGTLDTGTGERTVTLQSRSVPDPVRPVLLGFIPPSKPGEPVEVLFRGSVWNTQPVVSSQ